MRKTKIITLALTLIFILSIIGGCGKDKGPLDPKNPVSLTIWHYYHGAQQSAFDTLVKEFNDTVGKEKGIYVKVYGRGSVSDLESAVKDSIEGKVGSDAMPDIFSSYADTAYEIEEMGKLANLSNYITDEELDHFIQSYTDEGKIGKNSNFCIFPVAKSTEIMMINKTDWEKFSAETDVSLEDLSTMEGVVKVSEKYYNWTDEQTPDTANDGKAFFGRDSIANYFNIGMRQLGSEIFEVNNKGEVTLNTEKDKIKKLWENYYVPMVKGYFGAYGSFRSDDVKTGELIAYTGSTTSAMYFPDKVELDNDGYPIDYIILSAPIFENGEKYAVQQGAGMVVSKSDEQHEYAAVEFLKWFTKSENNLRFCSTAGYLPVLKEANSTKALDNVIEKEGLEIEDKTYNCIKHMFDTIDDVTLYTNKSFINGSKARSVLEYNLADKAAEDRDKVKSELAAGKSLDDACKEFVSDDAFEEWYNSFCSALKDAAYGK